MGWGSGSLSGSLGVGKAIYHCDRASARGLSQWGEYTESPSELAWLL